MMIAPADPAGEMSRASSGALSGRQPGAIAHALDALEAVALLGPGVTAQQLSARLTLSPATTYRLLNLLVAEEYIVRLPDLTGFALGRRALEFAGIAAPAPLALSRQARRTLARQRADLRWGVHLVAFVRGGARVIDADPDHPDPHDPLLLQLMRSLGSDGPDADGAALEVAMDWGDLEAGVGGVATAIRDETGALLAALVVVGPADRVRPAGDDLLRRLQASATELGELLA